VFDQDKEDAMQEISVPASEVRGKGRWSPPWLVAGTTAVPTGIVFCLATCAPWDAKHVLGSIGWGSLPGLAILIAACFIARASDPLAERQSKFRNVIDLCVVAVGTAIATVVVIGVYQFFQALSAFGQGWGG
jgi:hypothetical protein